MTSFPKCPLQNCCVDNWTYDDTTDNLFNDTLDVLIFSRQPPNYHIRGSRPLDYEQHYWEIKVEDCSNSSDDVVTIGIESVKKVDGQCKDDVGMLMKDEVKDSMEHMTEDDKKIIGIHGYPYKPFPKELENQTVLGVLLDRKLGTLSYYKNGTFIKVIWTGLNTESYDLFSRVVGSCGTRVTLGRRFRSFSNLQDRCRATIMRELFNESDTDLLPIPKSIKEYLNEEYRWCWDLIKSKRRPDVEPAYVEYSHYAVIYLCNVYAVHYSSMIDTCR